MLRYITGTTVINAKIDDIGNILRTDVFLSCGSKPIGIDNMSKIGLYRTLMIVMLNRLYKLVKFGAQASVIGIKTFCASIYLYLVKNSYKK